LWNRFSPEKIAKLVKSPIEISEPTISNQTNPTKSWTVPIPRLLGILYIIEFLQFFSITGCMFTLAIGFIR